MDRRTRTMRPLLLVAILLAGGCGVMEKLGLHTPDPAPVAAVAPAPEPVWERIGSSVRGKPIVATTIGDGARRVYIIGSTHGDEPECPAAAMELPRALAGSDALRHATIRILHDLNPDGTALRTRVNTRGVDLDRNWPSRDFVPNPPHSAAPMSENETVAVHGDLVRFNPDVVVVFQSSHRGPFVAMIAATPQEGVRFAIAAREHDPRWRFRPELRDMIPGSIASYVGRDRNETVITVEFQRGRDAATNARSVAAGLGAFLAPPAP